LSKNLSPVIVLGGGLTGLGIARVLGKLGIDVYLVVNKKDEAVYSKFCKKAYITPKFRENEKILKKVLHTISRNLGKRAVVYPTSDLDALLLSQIKEDFVDDFHFVVGNKKPVDILVNKKKFYKELNHHKIDYPATFFPEDLDDTKRIGADLTYPIFIRPSNSQLFSKTFTGQGKGFFAYSPKQLIQHYQLAIKHEIEVMFQEIIPGPPTNSFQFEGYYNKEHNPTVLFARQRIRIWPPEFGNSTLCVSIPLTKIGPQKIKVDNFLKEIGYNGLMSAEFKKDERDGKMKILEINARAWWHFWLSADCGADIMFSSYLDAIGEKNEYIENYKIGLKSIYFLPDFMASFSMFIKRNLSLAEWINSLKGISVSTFFSRADFSPFLMTIYYNILTLKQQINQFRYNAKV